MCITNLRQAELDNSTVRQKITDRRRYGDGIPINHHISPTVNYIRNANKHGGLRGGAWV